MLTLIVGDRASYSTYAPTLTLHDRTCTSYYRLRDTVCTVKLTYKVYSRSAEEPWCDRGVYGCRLEQRALSDPRALLTSAVGSKIRALAHNGAVYANPRYLRIFAHSLYVGHT